ncbi:MAG: DUF3048 domain-containing protein [Clostridiales bacterium]|nr:DUF3048 domain-containing protein [Clostridiales bacterium]
MKNTIKLLTAALLAAVILFCGTACEYVSGADASGVNIGSLPRYTVKPVQSAEPSSQTQSTTPLPSSSQTEQTQEPPHTDPLPEFTNAITGEPSFFDSTGLLPIAVVIDNGSGALAHQTGVYDADVLYETLVAPGVTRFLGIYSDYRAVDLICNVREGRASDVYLASEFGAVLVCHGGINGGESSGFKTALAAFYGDENAYISTVNEPAWTAQNASSLDTVKYYTDDYRTDIKYDTVLTPKAVDFVLSSEKYSPFVKCGGTLDGELKLPVKFAECDFDGESAKEFELVFTGSGIKTSLCKYVTMKYDEDAGVYKRYQGTQKHIDSESGEQLAYSNVLALFTDVTFTDGETTASPIYTDVGVFGTGMGYYFFHGKGVRIIWSNDEKDGLVLYSADGEITLSSGKTYIAFLDKANKSSVNIIK